MGNMPAFDGEIENLHLHAFIFYFVFKFFVVNNFPENGLHDSCSSSRAVVICGVVATLTTHC
jgi:hypothetical protein